MANLHVKKGDTVVVIAGKDKGKTGKVLSAMPSENAVVVEKVNFINKHKKKQRTHKKKVASLKWKEKLMLQTFK